MKVVCLRHVPFEGPGRIADWAEARGHDLRIVDVPDRGVAGLRPDLLVVLGGPMSATDVAGHPWLLDEGAFIRDRLSRHAPVLGICLGAQILASALGGTVRKARESEIGWYPVRLTEAGAGEPLFATWPREFLAGHWHGDTFTPPPGVEPAASSELTPSQAFVSHGGRAVALQFHLEWKREDMETLLASSGDDLTCGGRWVAGAADLLDDERLSQGEGMLFSLLDGMAALA